MTDLSESSKLQPYKARHKNPVHHRGSAVRRARRLDQYHAAGFCNPAGPRSSTWAQPVGRRDRECGLAGDVQGIAITSYQGGTSSISNT